MRKCSVEGCEAKHSSKGYCFRHAWQMRRHGKILNDNRFVQNKTVDIDENSIGIVLEDRQGNEKGITVVDKHNYEILKNYRWSMSYYGYAVAKRVRCGRHRMMHLFINPGWEHTDHINRNKLDNRESNLRECTHHQNTYNQPLKTVNTSGVIGVYWDTNRGKWHSFITWNRKRMALGRFDNKEEAIRARVQAEIKYFGEFAPQVDKYKHLLEGVAI